MMQPEHQAAYSQAMQVMRGVVADLNHLQRCIERGETVEQIGKRIETIVDVTASSTTRAGCALYTALQSAQLPAAQACAELDESEQVLKLTPRESQQFINDLVEPPAPSERLQAAARQLHITVKLPNSAE
jgi:1-aminocyclopropane-1-carboxylate deaminase/D-cysteine desulfhydrase-like pyridoxal-dependent ACC family enzyme